MILWLKLCFFTNKGRHKADICLLNNIRFGWKCLKNSKMFEVSLYFKQDHKCYWSSKCLGVFLLSFPFRLLISGSTPVRGVLVPQF